MNIWYVYILRCADDTLYTGVTTDPQRRLDEHNHDNRLAARYTRSRRPLTLVYQEQCADRSQACRREHEIRQLSRHEKEQLIKKYTLQSKKSRSAS
ncbi:MAG: GIY-YIG nuclease family protein [Gammaproteobacteria bacterium]|nr:GIY-YIG nuclease family protein [Gammaproteobacteria bacterium]MDH5653764.1 GIY-YIG nuclease family protein [Gammaproteobacteria bacterium]